MQLKKLKVHNFRNFDSLEVGFDSNVNMIIGKNGHGKTNLVEALYFFSKGKSFRTNKLNHLIRKGYEHEGAYLFLEFASEGFTENSEIKVKEGKKDVYLNNKKSSIRKLHHKLPIVLFSPESLSSIKEGPEYRRNLLDETSILETPENLQILYDFKRALKTRNKILKDYIQHRASKADVLKLLESVDPIFIEKASEVTQMRAQIIQKLESPLQSILVEITNQTDVETSVEYVINSEILQNNSKAEIYNTLHQELCEKREKELIIGHSLVGPHKHDVTFLFRGEDSRYFCSQGQQRALILAFKFSQIMYYKMIYNKYPILILDDVLSELDQEKRSFLVNFLKKNEAQTFMTTTDLDHDNLKALDKSVLTICEGRLT